MSTAHGAAAGPRETSETRSGHGADVADEDAAPEAGLPGPPASNGRGMRTSDIRDDSRDLSVCGKTASIDKVNRAIADAKPPLDPLPTEWQMHEPNEKQKESERRLVDSDHTSHHVFACIHNHRASGQRDRTAVMA